jgi:hypothetical protein
MYASDWLAVTSQQALRFFFERLRDVSDGTPAPDRELLYNASVLAHFATTSTASLTAFPASPVSLTRVFDLYVLDRSAHDDPEIMEAAASQILVLTGFFHDQLSQRHRTRWYAALGAGFYDSAAHLGTNPARAAMMAVMAARFEFWRRQHRRLAVELREWPLVLKSLPTSPPEP